MKIDGSSNKWRGRIIRYAPLIIWIGVIFYASSTSGSMSNTSRFIRPVLEFLFPNSPEQDLVYYHGLIRKSAHIAEYAVLAFLSSRAMTRSGNVLIRKSWLLASVVLVALVATLDELNQSFDAARTGSFVDVLIDLIGGFSAAAFIYLRRKVLSRRD